MLLFNPLEQAADFGSTLFHCLALHPEAIASPDGSILQGSQEAQSTAYNRILKKALRENVDEDGLPLCAEE